MRRFGLYPSFEGHETRLIHEDDLNEWQALLPYGKVFKLRHQTGGFLELGYGPRTFRVRPDLWHEVQDVAFDIGDEVTVLEGEAGATAIVRAFLWHFERKQVFYLLDRAGRVSTRRYFQQELQAT